MTAVLEAAIGLVFVYLILSLVVSAINEGLASLTDRRAEFLEKGIRNLLGDALAGRFYRHGLIRSLTRKDAPRTGRPAYISASTFSETVLDLVSALPSDAATTNASKFSRFRVGLSELPGSSTGAEGTAHPERDRQVATDLQQVLGLFAETASDLDDLKKRVESWFDEAMGRVSGWYRRHTRRILWVVGAIVVVSLNADTLNIVRTLWLDPSVRTAVVDAAEKAAEAEQPPDVTADSAADAVSEVQDLQVPLGWAGSDQPGDPRSVPQGFSAWLIKVMGLAFTTVAMTFGAPFWFDLLKRFVGLRASGPPARSGTQGGSPVGEGA